LRYFETYLTTRFSETHFSPNSGNARAEKDAKGIRGNGEIVSSVYRRYSHCYYTAGTGIPQSVYRRAVGLKAGIRFPAMARDSYLFHSFQTGCRARSASYTMGSLGYFSAAKRPVREAVHSLSSNVELKNVVMIPIPNSLYDVVST
jgi:hypothetical protein